MVNFNWVELTFGEGESQLKSVQKKVTPSRSLSHIVPKGRYC